MVKTQTGNLTLYPLIFNLFSTFKFSSTLMLILSAIHHFVRTTLFIECTPTARSSTKHMSLTVKDEDGNCQGWWYNAKHRSGICMPGIGRNASCAVGDFA